MIIEIGKKYKIKDKETYLYLQDGMVIRGDLGNIYQITDISESEEIIYFEWCGGDDNYEDGYGEMSKNLFDFMFEESE